MWVHIIIKEGEKYNWKFNFILWNLDKDLRLIPNIHYYMLIK